MFKHKKILNTIFYMWAVLLFLVSSSYALVITSPKDGETFKEGDTVIMVAEISPEDPPMILWVSFLATEGLGAECNKILTHPRYECSFTLPPDSPSVVKIRALGKMVEGAISSNNVTIHVTLPPTVRLQGLKSFTGNRLFFSKIGQNAQLYIEGIYSDGVDRELWLAQKGTTYSSSDEKVVTIDQDGLATAKGVGTAKITVKNGEHELQVQAVVAPKKQ